MGSCANTDDALRKELEDELMDVGERLLRFPSSNDELLLLLEEVESILSRVPQELVRSKTKSIIPIMAAMTTDELFRHADVNIQVAVASCLNEITRITAPTYPYPDKQMEEIFKLFMVALEELSSKPGSNYLRAQQILETLASVRSCLIMLDIEMDAMIVKMFQLFFNTIRSNHSCNIFKYMETIMTTIIEESDDISLELLKTLLDNVRMENKNVTPIGWELGKTVIVRCATKLEPRLREAVKHLDLKVGDYAEIVASACDVTSNGQNLVATTCLSGDGISKLDIISEAEQVNCTLEMKDINILDNENPPENSAEIAQLQKNHAHSDTEALNSAEKLKSEKDRGAQQRKRGKKPNSLMRPEEGYEYTWTRVGLDNNQEMGWVLALEAVNLHMPINDSSQRKSGSVKKVSSDKRGRPKKQESTSRCLDSNGKVESNEVSYKMSKRSHIGNGMELVDCGAEIVNSRVMIWWPLDRVFYSGTVESFDPLTKKHTIKYDDEEKEVLDLSEERWKLANKKPQQVKSSPKQEANHPSPANELVKAREKIAKRKSGSSKKQQAALSPQRSKSEGVFLVKDEHAKQIPH
ncbi:hypothetical protein CASFOL_038035 [Castilleja foliolosa]|uniref:Uncharacterized protein n=1 Tax=Castilleja foliolosa TaxID=1961234 RepID=A0ABD3BKC4_9LAMI